MSMEFDEDQEETDPEDAKGGISSNFFNENAYNGLNQELYVISEEDATSYKETLYSERDRANSIALQAAVED